jgi:cytochrome b pre-mRNA-processing protein 3|tara:strand:- start:207 stop:710 length:504 start_codon:yes stop_codon:yes gene_type:complete
MFAIYKTHYKPFYNKLVELSRDIFFYKKIQLKDIFETRINLIFVHLSIILIVFKEKEKNSFPQDIFDNIFLSIEYHIRELGYGDVAVNKKMKLLLRIFYDVLLKIRSTESKKKINKAILAKYLEPQNTNPNQLNDELANYFEEFYNFCFEIKNNSMLKGQINFKYKK